MVQRRLRYHIGLPNPRETDDAKPSFTAATGVVGRASKARSRALVLHHGSLVVGRPQGAFAPDGGHPYRYLYDRWRAGLAQRVAQTFLRRDRVARSPRFRLSAPGFSRHRRWASGSQRRPGVASRDDPAQVAGMADTRSLYAVAQARTRCPSCLCRRDRQQSRPAHARGCAPPDRAFGRSRHRPAAGLDPARHLRKRALGTVGGLRLRNRRAEGCDSGLHGVGRHSLCRFCFPAELLGRPQPDRTQRGAICPRGRATVLAGARQRAHRRHLARKW